MDIMVIFFFINVYVSLLSAYRYVIAIFKNTTEKGKIFNTFGILQH